MVEGVSERTEIRKPVKMSPATVKERVRCEQCGCDKVLRVSRQGFMRTRVYPLFGFFPWRCSRCGHDVMLHKRRRSELKDKKAEQE